MTPRLLSCFALLVLVAPQTRDTPARPEPAGTGVLAGVILSEAPAPAPIRRALVSVSGGELALVRSAISDDQGRFSIGGLPAGRFALSASKAAFIRTEFGARRPGGPGTAIALATGQRLSGLRVTMPRGAVISGVVVNEHGRPTAGLQVSVIPAVPPASVQFASDPVATATTDDRGAYRVFGLLPGAYYVMAGMRSATLSRDSLAVMHDAEVDAALAELRRGRGATPAGAPMPRTTPKRVATPGVVFYPGAVMIGEAAPVTVAAGDERSGVDFAYRPTPTANVTATVTSSYGPLPALNIAINPAGVRMPVTGPVPLGVIPRLYRDTPQGRFMIYNLQPGQYTIAVQSTTPVPVRITGGGGATAATPVAESPMLLWATADVVVNGEDVSGLTLALRPAMRVSGRVVFDGRTPPPADLRTLSLNLVSTQSAGGMVYGMTTTVGLTRVPPTQVRADGTFESPGVLPGGYRLTSMPPRGWQLRSAMLSGRDVLDYPVEIDADRDVSGVVITYTDQRTDLTGTLQTAAGAPASDYFILVFPADAGLRRAGSRRVQSTRPASDGHYAVRELPAGDYLIAVLPDLESSDLADPTFFAALVSASAKVTLIEGRAVQHDLKFVR